MDLVALGDRSDPNNADLRKRFAAMRTLGTVPP
jgi:hypothetical protein